MGPWEPPCLPLPCPETLQILLSRPLLSWRNHLICTFSLREEEIGATGLQTVYNGYVTDETSTSGRWVNKQPTEQTGDSSKGLTHS